MTVEMKIFEMSNMSEKLPDEEAVYPADASPNSEGSSSKSKRFLEGGPYGDGPSKTQQMYRDSVVFILQGNQESAETSECSEGEGELYSLRNEYLHKLKILRRKLETIHPFTLSYNDMKPESKTNILDIEYNPPKKKSCIRVKTPKLVSDCNIPYRTQISLHENLFRNTTERADQTDAENKLSQEYMKKFTVTREVQCCEEELDSALGSSKKITNLNTDNSLNINLFPKVVINYDHSSQMQPSSSSSSSARCSKLNSEAVVDKIRISLPNYVEDSSGDCCTPATSITVVESSKEKTKKSKLKSKPFLQYITYRKDTDRAKSTPIKIQSMVPFGPVILQDFEKSQRIDSRFYLFDSTSGSEEEKYGNVIFSGRTVRAEPAVNINEDLSFCSRLCCCFKTMLNIFSKKEDT